MPGKDVLEFPLEELGVPQAISLMMSEAARTGGEFNKAIDPADDPKEAKKHERLAALSEKLEARIQDELDKGAAATEPPPVVEDSLDEPVDEADIFLSEDGLTLNMKGVLFQKACNQPVYRDQSNSDLDTFCIKRFGHDHPVHEDIYGNEAG